MIYPILIVLAGFLATIFVGQTVKSVSKVLLMRRRFKKCSTMPMAPGFSIIGGHAYTYLTQKRVCILTDEFHKKLGKSFGFIWLDNFGVATTDLDLLKTLVIDEAKDHINRVDTMYIPFDEFEIDSPVLAKDSQWKRIRKCTAPAFSSHKIKALNVSEDVQYVIDKFAGSLDTRIDEAMSKGGVAETIIDIEDLAHRYAVDIVFTCFYKQKSKVDYLSKVDYYTDIIDSGMRTILSVPVLIATYFPLMRRLIQWLIVHFHTQGVLRRDIMNFIKAQTKSNFEAKKKLGSSDESKFKFNMIDYITDEFYHGKLTKREYFHSAFFMFLAADKTSADAISKLIYNLAVHQDIQTKLRESVTKYGTDSEYLSWCINESLRVFPPAPIGCSRTAERDIETKYGRVPAGTFVFSSTYSIHRLKEYWGPDADEYNPDRWAGAKNFHPLQFIPFGFGPRGCPGKDFALFEVKLLMSTLLKRFKFDYVPDENNKLEFQSPLLVFTIFDLPTYVKISRV